MSNPTAFFEESDTYTLNFEERDRYLYAFVGEGGDSLDVSKEFWRRVLERCEESACGKLLVEEDLDGNLNPSEIYELALWLTKLEFTGKTVAFVDRRMEHQEINQLGELIVTNRGVRIRVFNSVKEAESWLIAE